MGFLDDTFTRARFATSAFPTSRAGRSRRPPTWLSTATSPAPIALQPQYNLLVREIEWEIIPACAENGLGLLHRFFRSAVAG